MERVKLMKIKKILNNNFVIGEDEKNQEYVISGRGVAFKRKIGDTLNSTDYNRIYTLSSKDMNNKFQQLIADIPLEHIEVANEIIDQAKLQLGKTINDNVIISLSDHIYTAIQRFLDGLTFRNALLWDIKRFYEDEFNVGIIALDIIEKHFKIRLPIDEAASIAFHIVSAESDENIHNVFEITKVMQEICNIIKYHFGVEFNTDSVYYYRFITHLKFFSQRLIQGKTYSDGNSDKLFSLIKSTYVNSFECVNKIADFLNRKYQYELSDEEKLYLTIHIENVIYKKDKAVIS